MADLYRDIKDILSICGDNSSLKIRKGVNIFHFNKTDDYRQINVIDIPSNEIDITYGGVEARFNPFTYRDESRDKYVVSFSTKRGSTKKMYVYMNHISYDSNTPRFVESIKDFFGYSNYNDTIFDDVEKFISSFYTMLKKENNSSLEEKMKEQDILERNNNRVTADKKDIIESKANAILDKLGEKKAESMEDNYARWVAYKNVYELYGLEIIKMGKDGPLKEGLWIKYNGKTVLSPLEKYTYEEGRWEELLDEIYNNLYDIFKKKESDDSSLIQVLEVVEKINKNIKSTVTEKDIEYYSNEIVEIMNRIMKEKNIEINVVSHYELDYYLPQYSVKYNGELVFNAVYSKNDQPFVSRAKNIQCSDGYHCLEKFKFINGPWVYNLRDSIDKAYEIIEEKNNKIYNDDIDKKIKLIRNFK